MKNHLLIFVPGMLGTALHDHEGPVWTWEVVKLWDTLTAKSHRLLGELKVGEVIKEFKLGPIRIRQGYGPLLNQLKTLGYDEGNFVKFGYDWRGDIETAANNLATLMRDKLATGTTAIKIIAHSLGSLVVRCALSQNPDIAKHVDRFIQIAGPGQGSPEAYHAFREPPQLRVLYGLHFMLEIALLLNNQQLDRLHDVLATFDSVFQVLPHEEVRSLIAPDGKGMSALHPPYWHAMYHPKLTRASIVHSLIEQCQHPKTLAYYAIGLDTHLLHWVDNVGNIQRTQAGPGDGTVPAYSARHNCAEEKIISGRVFHYDLPNCPELLQDLKRALT